MYNKNYKKCHEIKITIFLSQVSVIKKKIGGGIFIGYNVQIQSMLEKSHSN